MGHPIFKHMNSGMSRASSAEKYDAKQAYNKDLDPTARMHYLENDIAAKKGSPNRMEGGRKDHKMSNSEYSAHLQSPKGKKEHGAGMSRYSKEKGMSRYSKEKGMSMLGDLDKNGTMSSYETTRQNAIEKNMGTSRKASPANNVSYGTGYIGEKRYDDMKYNPVVDRAGMSRYAKDEAMSRNSSPARVEGLQPNQPDNNSKSSAGLNTGKFYVVGGGQGTGGGSITGGMSQEPVVITAKGSGNNISSGKTRVEHRADKTRMKIDATDDAVVKRRREGRLARLDKRAAKKEVRQGKRYARKKDKGQRIDNKFGVEGQGGKDYNV